MEEHKWLPMSGPNSAYLYFLSASENRNLLKFSSVMRVRLSVIICNVHTFVLSRLVLEP